MASFCYFFQIILSFGIAFVMEKSFKLGFFILGVALFGVLGLTYLRLSKEKERMGQ